MSKVSMAEVLQLSIDERIKLAEDIWESIAASPQPLILTDEQGAELDRRLEDYHKHPEDGTPWEVVKKRVLGHE
jgi:putative addiction module component (TIGR02574 family)